MVKYGYGERADGRECRKCLDYFLNGLAPWCARKGGRTSPNGSCADFYDRLRHKADLRAAMERGGGC